MPHPPHAVPADKSAELKPGNPNSVKGVRNPGPSWGYWFLRTADQLLPEWLYRPLRALGTAIAMTGMPEQRRHSKAYLEQILGRQVGLREIFTHFFAFEETLMLKLRLSNGRHFPARYAPNAEAFTAWMENGGPVLLGTMHFGVSDMLGVQIGSVHKRQVFIVRQRVGNSHDTEKLEARFGEHVHFLWINDPKEMLFALKEAAATEHAIALQCDRPEHCSRMEAFQFLGARRLFPFTIYHLALLFNRPVLLSVGTRDAEGWSVLHASPLFEVIKGEPKPEALARARKHFQDFLLLVEGLLHENPYQWFNFLPLNPKAPDLPPPETPKSA